MRNKRIIVIGFALILLALNTGTIFAASIPREGFYDHRTNRNLSLGIERIESGEWRITFWEGTSISQQFSAREAITSVGTCLVYSIGSRNFTVQQISNYVKDSRTGGEYIFNTGF